MTVIIHFVLSSDRWPPKKQGHCRSLFLLGFLEDGFLSVNVCDNTKRPVVVFRKKFHAAKSVNQG